jgi:hypothetical protein
MDGYLIGAGALLTAGPASSISAASLHAQTDALLAGQVEAAVIDFEAASDEELSRILILAPGWSPTRFAAEVTGPLLARRECTLADVIAQLGKATAAHEVHVFARWLPGPAVTSALQHAGIDLVAHPLEAIERAALVCDRRLRRWNAPFRAA